MTADSLDRVLLRGEDSGGGGGGGGSAMQEASPTQRPHTTLHSICPDALDCDPQEPKEAGSYLISRSRHPIVSSILTSYGIMLDIESPLYTSWAVVVYVVLLSSPIAIEFIGWVLDWPSVTGRHAWEVRLEELSYLVAMNASWLTCALLVRRRGQLLRHILCDPRLIRFRKPLFSAYSLTCCWVVFTIYAHSRVLREAFKDGNTASVFSSVCAVLHTPMFASTVMLFVLCCAHVIDKVETFAYYSSLSTIHELRQQFVYVCGKFRQLASFFNIMVDTCNFCALLKFSSMLLQMDMVGVNVTNILLAARMLAIVLAMDYACTRVSESGRLVPRRIAEWHDATGRASHDQAMTLQLALWEERNNFRGVKLLGFALTPSVLLRLLYLLSVMFIYAFRGQVKE